MVAPVDGIGRYARPAVPLARVVAVCRPRSAPTRPPAREARRWFECRRVVRGVLGGLKCRCGRHVRQGGRGFVRRGSRAGRVACAC
eukprot:6912264-Prymnesium_polylepis.1